MKKLISFIAIMVLLVTLSLSYPTASAKTKFKVTATSTTTSVKLKWNKVKGAKYYKVYRKTANTKYRLVCKKTTKRSFTNKKLKSDKKYTYKVKAFKKNKKGKFYSFKSAVKSVKTKKVKVPQTTFASSTKDTTTMSSTLNTTTTTATVSTVQPTIPITPITTEAKGYEELVKEARLRELQQDPRTAHATLDDIRIDYYFGTFNDCIVVMIDDNFTTQNCSLYDIYVEGIKFHYPDSNRAIALKDGVFYQLQQAYDNGFLTLEDLQTIANTMNVNCKEDCCS